MTELQHTSGAVTVTVLPIGFRFSRAGAPGRGRSSEWVVTSMEQLEEMECRARSLRRPDSSDMLGAIRWAVDQVRAGVVTGMGDLR